jgi:hypothetical protein
MESTTKNNNQQATMNSLYYSSTFTCKKGKKPFFPCEKK